MGALGQGFGHPGTAQAMLGQCGGPGAGAAQLPPGGDGFVFECAHQHAGAEQLNTLAPQARPGRYLAVLDGDGVAVGSHDPRRDLAGAGVFGLARAARRSCMIGADAPIAARERVVAVGAQWDTIGAGRSGSAWVGDPAARQAFGCSAFGAFVLARRGSVLVGVGVAPGAIQRLLAGPGFVGSAGCGVVLLGCAADPFDDQLLGPVGREGRHGHVGHVGVHRGPPGCGDLGAPGPGGRRLIPSLTSSSRRITDTGPSYLKFAAFDLPRRRGPTSPLVAVVTSAGAAAMAIMKTSPTDINPLHRYRNLLPLTGVTARKGLHPSNI